MFIHKTSTIFISFNQCSFYKEVVISFTILCFAQIPMSSARLWGKHSQSLRTVLQDDSDIHVSDTDTQQSWPMKNREEPMMVYGSDISVSEIDPQPRIISRCDNCLIIGWDERKVVENTTLFPYNTIGKVQATRPDNSSRHCTGTYIGFNKVVTAAHCVFDIKNPENIYDIEIVYISVYGKQYKPKNIIPLDGFLEGYFYNHTIDIYGQYDLAVLIIEDENFLEPEDTMSYGFPGCKTSYMQTIYIVGYPADLNGGKYMYQSTCSAYIDTCSDVWIWYDCDTSIGMSGGTIWTYDEDLDSLMILGVHSRYRNLINVGILLNRQVVSFLQSIS
eukprot:TRINITY_DN5680_c0_g1_i2.p1 TRINITY_DN5680_c0_g1~~TRINITY_DN5680_c0_g1_i2.p1  ORF type:complete len:332 (+),score=1.03 TRINITY_DN5680_c0_g1_i2:147-1142(+)